MKPALIRFANEDCKARAVEWVDVHPTLAYNQIRFLKINIYKNNIINMIHCNEDIPEPK
jgi:hypothetical protein